MRQIELKPIKESPEDFEEIEKKIKELFKREYLFTAFGRARSSTAGVEKFTRPFT